MGIAVMSANYLVVSQRLLKAIVHRLLVVTALSVGLMDWSTAASIVSTDLGTYEEIAGYATSSLMCDVPPPSSSETGVSCSDDSYSETVPVAVLGVHAESGEAGVLIRSTDSIELDDGNSYEITSLAISGQTDSGVYLGAISLKRPGFPARKGVWVYKTNSGFDPSHFELLVLEGEDLEIEGETRIVEELTDHSIIGERVGVSAVFNNSYGFPDSIIMDLASGFTFWSPDSLAIEQTNEKGDSVYLWASAPPEARVWPGCLQTYGL